METKRRIVTIDGPAGAGKSTIARSAARALGFAFLDTGAIYRAATLAAMNAGLDLKAEHLDTGKVFKAVDDCRVDLVLEGTDKLVVVLDGRNVTEEIRSQNVTRCISHVADIQEVRALITERTREIAASGGFVCEGRDQGTVVFPDAFLKIYLWAEPAERARRRAEDLKKAGETVGTLEDLEREIRRRDMLDMSREVGGLKKAADAEEIDSTHLSVEQVTEKIASLARQRM